MALDRLPLPLRLALYAVAAAVLLYLCLAPSKALPSVNVWDKAEHAIAWAVLAGSGLILFPRHPARIAVFALAFGALVEILQGALPFGRDMDIMDLVADSVGVAASLALYALVRQGRR
jgi:VanZ family protein